MATDNTINLYIVTGYSGAGKSTVLKACEDLGYFCVDNLPVPLFATFFTMLTKSSMPYNKIVLGIDIRAGNSLQELVDTIQSCINEKAISLKVIFIKSSKNILMKRYQETRRKHPLMDGLQMLSLEQAINLETTLLAPLESRADLVVDTDQLNVHELRRLVQKNIVSEVLPRMMVSLMSFGYKYGVPAESNFVYDIRSLPNPYFIEHLKELDGTTEAIHEYLFNTSQAQDYFARLQDFLTFTINKSYQEGRSFMHVAIGCTGGRHRSVAFVEALAKLKIDNVQFLVKHRDIMKDISHT